MAQKPALEPRYSWVNAGNKEVRILAWPRVVCMADICKYAHEQHWKLRYAVNLDRKYKFEEIMDYLYFNPVFQIKC